MAFGLVLRQIRQGKLLRKGKTASQEALSFLSGLDRTTVSQMERGKRNPSLKTLLMLSKALEVPADQVVCEVLKLDPDVPVPEISSYLESSQPTPAKALRKTPYRELTSKGYKSICAGMASCGWMSHPLACLRTSGRSCAALKRALLETETFAAYKAGREPPTFSVKDIELITINYTDEHGWQEIPVLLNRAQECFKKWMMGRSGYSAMLWTNPKLNSGFPLPEIFYTQTIHFLICDGLNPQSHYYHRC